MALSKKYYDMLAGIIRKGFEDIRFRQRYLDDSADEAASARSALRKVAFRLSRELEADNPNFNPHRFMEACYPKEE